MLQVMREKIQGWIASIIIGILVIAFALWGIEYYLERGGSTNVVAKVNGKPISEGLVNAVFERLRSNQTLDVDAQAKLKQQALRQIISAQVLSEGALKSGYRISPAQLDDVIMQLPAFQFQGQFSPQRFQQVLTMMGYSQDQFIADLQRTLLVNQMQIGVVNSAFALPNEAQQALRLANQKRDISYLIIPANKFLDFYKRDPNAINTYYQHHQDQFKTPEKVSIEYVELSVEQLGKNLSISPQELQQYYQNNNSAFIKNGKTLPFAQVKNEIEKNLKQQKLQQLFSDQSQKLSDLTYTDPNTLNTAATTLHLPIQTSEAFTRSGAKAGIAANPQVVAAAFNDDVLKNGNNSNLISIKDGTVIVLRVKNYQPATVQPLAQVQPQIEQILRQQFAQNYTAELGKKVLANIQQGESLQKAAQQANLEKYGLSWQFKNAVSRQMPGIDAQILRAAFNLPKPTNPSHPSVGDTTLASGDYALVVTISVSEAAAPLSPQQLQVSESEIQNSFGQLEYQLLIDDFMKHARIKIMSSASNSN